MNQIVMVLLTNGEEVFGELTGENDKGIDLNNALVVQYTTVKGVPTILFRKYCSYSNNFDVFFKREHIVAVFKDLKEEVIKTYCNTMSAYNTTDVKGFLNSDEILEDEDDYSDIDVFLDDEFDLNNDDINDSIYYKNKKRKVH